MEILPEYIEGQVPQSSFDALLVRIAVPLSQTHPDARAILESFVESQKAPTYNGLEKGEEPPKPIDHFPQYSEVGAPDPYPLISVKQAIVKELFDAIAREDNESIALLIQHNIVTANTTYRTGQTPLLEAVSANKISIAKELLDLGADPNAFGQLHVDAQNVPRTPLMLAASKGSLPFVKLLFEPPYSADDALVAPDGQIALRLAAENGHRTIVEYLPSRRAGHFLRFKMRNAHNIARAKRALKGIYTFLKFFIWEIPKFFLWSVPKHVVVLPVVKSCKCCWSKRKKFGSWCKRQATEVPRRVWRTIKKVPKALGTVGKGLWEFVTVALPRWLKDLAKWIWEVLTKHIPKAIVSVLKWIWEGIMHVWKAIKKVPSVMADMGRWLWVFVTVTFAGWLKNVANWSWELFTERIPKAFVIAVKWLWGAIKSFGQAIWGVLVKFVSFLHTIFAAIITFLHDVTIMDVWTAFRNFLSAVFITIPKTIWSLIAGFGTTSYEIMGALFGLLGELVWWICAVLVQIVAYIPRKCWTILQSIWSSLIEAAHEIWVWINPKA